MFRSARMVAVAMFALAAPATGQTARPALDYASAATIRDACLAWAAERNLKVAVAVFDRHGLLVTAAHMDGAPTAVGEIAQWKGRSAATVQFATAATAKWGGHGPGIADWKGGLPFATAAGAPLGGVGASGARADEDEACGRAGIAAAGLVPVEPK